ncbi:hypothetical protein Ancab_011724 [Ancistrocladus abbreviatus]
MAGRNPYPPPHLLQLREIPLQRGTPHPAILIEDPRLRLVQTPHPAVILEERLAAHQREIQTLLVDNQRLAATHVALKQELSLAEQDLRHLTTTAREVKSERDAEVREVYNRSLKTEAVVRAIEALKNELIQVREDIKKLSEIKLELCTKLKAIDGDLAQAKLELKEMPAIKAEIELMHQELQKGRAAVEFEKKTHAANLEQSRAMEKNMISMAHEIEKLRAELANAEKRARAVAAAAAAANPGPGYAGSYGNPGIGHGGSNYPAQYAMHQVQASVMPAPHYGPGVVAHGPFDLQQTHAQR